MGIRVGRYGRSQRGREGDCKKYLARHGDFVSPAVSSSSQSVSEMRATHSRIVTRACASRAQIVPAAPAGTAFLASALGRGPVTARFPCASGCRA
jgi:hypothetical protein